MLEKISNYVNDKEFRLTLYNDKIHIINYKKIISLENNYLSILCLNKKILVTGNNLILSKILDNELLIKGNINNIEVIDV
ncbi:MAG: YabP/YqfC family sporulation protein [Bacilli bacterium]|nr:YabP/YqfC family sporulation protein [Bacilli bacterium]